MNQKGFSQIVLGIIVAVILAVGMGGYVFVSKQKLTPSVPSKEIIREEKAVPGIPLETEVAPESIPKTENVAPTEKKTESVVQKEPPSVKPADWAGCSDGTLHNNQCSATQPLICASGKLKDDCRTCGCPDSRVCSWDGTCAEIIFSKESIEPYASWQKINPVLSALNVAPVLIESERKITPNELEREQMKESLAYVVYIFEELFRGTPIKSFLKEFKEVRMNLLCCVDIISGPLWKGELEFFQISLLSSFLSAEGIPSKDRYMIVAIHEIGHVIHQNLSKVEPTIYEEFNTICWVENGLIEGCQEREKSFVPSTMTLLKPLRNMESQKSVPPDYYSLKDAGEDFAETLAAYIASPTEFRNLAGKFPKLAQKYEFMKARIFGGKEF